MINKPIKQLFAILVIFAVLSATACDSEIIKAATGQDERSLSPTYIVDGEGNQLFFQLDLKERSDASYREENDGFSHSDENGKLIKSWTVPYFGNTVYESITEFFIGKKDSLTFYLSGNYYYFNECRLADGKSFDLRTAYISRDGKYAKTANYEKLAGDDGIFGSLDDLKVLTIVYRGWL